MVLLVGGNHHQDPVRPAALFLEPDGPVHGGFPDGDGGPLDVFGIDAPLVEPFFEDVVMDPLQHLLRVPELGHDARVPQVCGLYPLHARKGQFLEIVDLGLRGDPRLLVLEPVPHGDVPEAHAPRHPRMYLEHIVLAHVPLLDFSRRATVPGGIPPRAGIEVLLFPYPRIDRGSSIW